MTSQHAIPMLPKQRENLAGKQRTELRKCAQIPGDGSPITRTDTKTDQDRIHKKVKADLTVAEYAVGEGCFFCIPYRNRLLLFLNCRPCLESGILCIEK